MTNEKYMYGDAQQIDAEAALDTIAASVRALPALLDEVERLRVQSAQADEAVIAVGQNIKRLKADLAAARAERDEANALVAQAQDAYYVRQLAERYTEIVALKRQRTAPRCDDCNAELAESPDGDMRCRVCGELEETVQQLRRDRPRVDEDDERGPRGLR